MVYLLILLAIFGLVQSLLELKKDKLKGSKWSIEKILSIIYVLAFIAGFVTIVWQNSKDTKSGQTLENISFSIKKIDSTSYFQLQKLSKSVEETEKLLIMTDSMNMNLSSVVEIRESLISQTNSLNSKLARQIENDKKLINANKPALALLESDMNWLEIDSVSKGMEFCIRNLGNRSAEILSIKGNTLYFDKQNRVVYNIITLEKTGAGFLQPTNLSGQRLCPFTSKLRYADNYDSLNFVAIYLKVKYLDVFDNSIHQVELFSGWNPYLNTFGKLREWEKQLVVSWLQTNYSAH